MSPHLRRVPIGVFLIATGHLFAAALAAPPLSGNLPPYDAPAPQVPIPHVPVLGLPPLEIEPIDGFTTVRHKAPTEFSIPVGTVLRFCQRLPDGQSALSVFWENAQPTGQTGSAAFAECPMTIPGEHEIRVKAIGAAAHYRENRCTVKVVNIRPERVFLRSVTPTVSPAVLNEQMTNEETMKYFFGKSIAELTRVQPDRTDRSRSTKLGSFIPHYRTSVDRPITFDVETNPSGFESLMEVRFFPDYDHAPFLGTSGSHTFEMVGERGLMVGPVGRERVVDFDVYRVTITSHISGQDIVSEGQPITFTAVTEPPGYEDEITWVSSTKYGTAKPVTGQGPTFTTQFDDTWGDDPQMGRFQWLGVKADNATFGQDQKTGLVCSLSESVSLGTNGTFVLPDWRTTSGTNRPFTIDNSYFQGAITITQNPLPGAIFNTPQSINVTITATGQAGGHAECMVPITLKDGRPPEVQITSPISGQYFVAPVSIVPEIEVTDDTDANPVVTAFLDDSPYSMGNAISSIGPHLLRVEAMDASGNVGTATSVFFEIRPRILHSAVAVLSQYSCFEDVQTGFAEFNATVLLASQFFQETDVNLYTLYFWGLNQHALPLNRDIIPISGSINPNGGGYDYTTAQATYQNGYWTLNFGATLADQAIIGCPTHFRLTGAGNRDLPNEFDVESLAAPMTVDPNPVQTLTKLGLTFQDAPQSPRQEPRWPRCEWKDKLEIGALDDKDLDKANTCIGGTTQTWGYLWALGGKFGGVATAIDTCAGLDATNSGSVTSNAIMTVWLEGPKECCDCKITCILTPKFKARTEVNPPAKAVASGMLDIVSDCDANARAIGGVQSGDATPVTITFGAGASVGKDGPAANANIQVQMTVVPGKDNEQSFTDNKLGNISKCMTILSIVSTGKLDVFADASLFNWYAEAKARLKEASPGIEVRAKCQTPVAPCTGDEKKFSYK